MLRISKVAVACALASTTLALGAPGAGAITSPLDIRVEHDLPAPEDDSEGPRVLEVTDVTPGPGPEITVDDEVANPDPWGGNVLVDIDPDARTITVEVEDSNCYGSVLVEITTDEIVSVTNVSDELFEDASEVDRSEGVSGGVVTLSWMYNGEETCPSLGDAGSQAVFSYTLARVMEITPTTASPGVAVNVNGDGCVEGNEVAVVVSLDGDEVATEVAPVNEDGTWTTDVLTDGFAAGTYTVDATCAVNGDPLFDYDQGSFVLESEAAPTTTAPPSPTTPTEPAQSPAATPVVAQPTFTG